MMIKGILFAAIAIASMIAAPAFLAYPVAAQNDTSTDDGTGTTDGTTTDGGTGTTDGTTTDGGTNATDSNLLGNFQGVDVSGGKGQDYFCTKDDKTGITLQSVTASATRKSQTAKDWTGSFSIQGSQGGAKHGDLTSGTASDGKFSLKGTVSGKDTLCSVGAAANQTSAEASSKDITFSTTDCPGTSVKITVGSHSNTVKHVETHCRHSQ